MLEISKGQIKKIKVLQRAAGLDDDLYREMLWGVARVKSCKDLRGPKIQVVIKHLEQCVGKQGSGVRGQGPEKQGSGVRGQGAGKARYLKPETQNLPTKATEAQWGEIRRLWGRASRAGREWGPESAQAHQALKTFLWGRFKVAAPEWLTLAQASRVIEAVKAMNKREERACGAG